MVLMFVQGDGRLREAVLSLHKRSRAVRPLGTDAEAGPGHGQYGVKGVVSTGSRAWSVRGEGQGQY